MTLQRVCMFLWVFSVLACSGGDAAPLKRPAKTDEPGAARVLHLQGQVKVTPTGAAPFTAAVDQDLVRSDLLEPGDGAFAVLGLANGHLVRIDDVGALKVGQILLVDSTAPPARTERDQLLALLDPAERNGFPVQNVVDRAAAWRQMRRAGESAGRASDRGGSGPAATSKAGASTPTGGAALESVSSGRANQAPQTPVPIAQVAPPPPAEPEKSTASKEGVTERKVEKPSRKKDAGGMDDLVEGDADAGAPPPPRAAPVVQVTPTTTEPAVLARFGVKPGSATSVAAPFLGGDLRACLEASAVEHHVDIGAIELRLEVKAGVITRVRFGRALPVTLCATGLVDRGVASTDGWLVVTAGPAP